MGDDLEVILWSAEADQLALFADAGEIHALLARAPAAVRETTDFLYLTGFADAQDGSLSFVDCCVSGSWGQGVRDWKVLSKCRADSGTSAPYF